MLIGQLMLEQCCANWANASNMHCANETYGIGHALAQCVSAVGAVDWFIPNLV